MAKTDRAAVHPAVQFTPVEIGGRTYQLSYTFNGLAEAEAITGCNLLQGMAAVVNGGISATQLRGVLYAALQKSLPEITLEEAGALAETVFIEGSFPTLHLALLKAYRVSTENPSKAEPQAENSGGAS